VTFLVPRRFYWRSLTPSKPERFRDLAVTAKIIRKK
jgi:hypothetical protein